jgi:hypothetical protein
VRLRKVPETNTKTFDHELLSGESGERRVAAVEVKKLVRAPRTPENGWVPTEYGGMVRAHDNSAARVGRVIHEAYKQLKAAAEPKVLVFVNDEHMDALDLKEALNGYLIYGNGDTRFKNPSAMKVARGTIRAEKYLIDLYVWINRYEGRIPYRLDGQPLEAHAQRGPFLVYGTDPGYELARKFFNAPAAPKPENDPDDDVPTLGEMLLRQAGIKR